MYAAYKNQETSLRILINYVLNYADEMILQEDQSESGEV